MRQAHRQLVDEAVADQHLPPIEEANTRDPDANVDDLENPHAGTSGAATQRQGDTQNQTGSLNRTRRQLFVCNNIVCLLTVTKHLILFMLGFR